MPGFLLDTNVVSEVVKILPDPGVTWGRMMGDCDRRGRPRAASDGRIAAVALRFEMIVVTRNEKDFSGLGARTFSRGRVAEPESIEPSLPQESCAAIGSKT